MKYEYRARDRSGALHCGEIEAANEYVLIQALSAKDYFILDVRQKTTNMSSFNPEINICSWLAVSEKDLVLFTRQLALMLRAGIPIIKCFRIIRQQTSDNRLRTIIGLVEKDLESGWSMYEALSRHPRVFARLYTNLVRVGERGGVLDQVLFRLSDYLDEQRSRNAKILNAAIYPLTISVVSLATVALLVLFVLPKICDVLVESGLSLPATTRLLINVATCINNWGPEIGFTCVTTLLLAAGMNKTNSGRYFYDWLLIKAPIVGAVIKKISIARFALALGMLIESGIPILEALEIVQETTGNMVISSALAQACLSIRDGNDLHRSLGKTNIFEPMVLQMIAVGEETGCLDRIMVYIANNYALEQKQLVENLSAILEPGLILVVALGVGIILVAILQPLLEITNLAGM